MFFRQAGIFHTNYADDRRLFPIPADRYMLAALALFALTFVLNTVAEEHGLPVIVSTHPRTMKRIEQTGSTFHRQVRLLKPLGFLDYNKLQLSARYAVGDRPSSEVFREQSEDFLRELLPHLMRRLPDWPSVEASRIAPATGT